MASTELTRYPLIQPSDIFFRPDITHIQIQPRYNQNTHSDSFNMLKIKRSSYPVSQVSSDSSIFSPQGFKLNYSCFLLSLKILHPSLHIKLFPHAETFVCICRRLILNNRAMIALYHSPYLTLSLIRQFCSRQL